MIAAALCTGIVVGFLLGIAATCMVACWAFRKVALG